MTITSLHLMSKQKSSPSPVFSFGYSIYDTFIYQTPIKRDHNACVQFLSFQSNIKKVFSFVNKCKCANTHMIFQLLMSIM